MCIFCKIVAGEIPSNKIAENDKFVAFHDVNPIAPIHVLVIPKEHIASFNEITSEIMADMTLFIQEVAKILNLDKDGYRMITNIGENGGQEVKHIHFHMLGGAKLK